MSSLREREKVVADQIQAIRDKHQTAGANIPELIKEQKGLYKDIRTLRDELRKVWLLSFLTPCQKFFFGRSRLNGSLPMTCTTNFCAKTEITRDNRTTFGKTPSLLPHHKICNRFLPSLQVPAAKEGAGGAPGENCQGACRGGR